MNSESYPNYFRGYIERVPERDPLQLLEEGLRETLKTLAMVTDEKASESYEEGKWSIKDIVQHMIDTERIFSYRAMSLARGEKGKIPGYDHEAYGKEAMANQRTLKELLEEFKTLRAVTIDLFSSFNEQMMKRKGNANGVEISVEQLQYILIGHELHHIDVIYKRYLK